MSIINRVENIATITYDGNTIHSLPTETLLLVLPTILKTVDKAIASIGEILTYTVTITNIGLTSIANLVFSDIIPAGTDYVDGSFKLNGSTVVPTIASNTLSYTLPTIAALGIDVIRFQVEVVGGEN